MPTTPPQISIALCTYNGAAYLREQLQSLSAQTRQPDELLICDDGSSDQTVGIARAFADSADFPVRVEVNPANLGIWRNFARAFALAGGDWVMFCDQDDVWRADKIERFEREMLDPAVGLIFCDARVVDPMLKPIGHTHWQTVGFTSALQERFRAAGGFGVLLRHSFVACATMAVRADLREVILPLPELWEFDAWAAVVASALSEARIIDQPLNEYRQHPRQALGGAKKGFWRRYLEARRAADGAHFARLAEMAGHLRDRLADRVPSARRREIDGKVRFARARADMRQSILIRYPLLAAQVLTGRYWRYGQGFRSIIVDAVV